MPHIVAIDLETTGFSLEHNEIAEIGLVRLTEDLRTEICSFSSKVRIEHIQTASPQALQVFGYSPESWDGAPPLGAIIRLVADLAAGAVPLGYNTNFDVRFLNNAFAVNGIKRPWAGEWFIDVMQRGAKLKKEGKIPKKSLAETALYTIGVVQMEPHRALDDARLAVAIEQWGRGCTPKL